MSHNSYFHGSDSYVGHCPKCDRRTGTNYDELCEECFEGEPIQCPDCGDHVQPDQMHGSICLNCYYQNEGLRMEEVESVWCNEH